MMSVVFDCDSSAKTSALPSAPLLSPCPTSCMSRCSSQVGGEIGPASLLLSSEILYIDWDQTGPVEAVKANMWRYLANIPACLLRYSLYILDSLQ